MPRILSNTRRVVRRFPLVPTMFAVAAGGVFAAAGGSARGQTIQAVPPVSGGGYINLEDVNADGTAAAGYSDDASSSDRAVRWTSAGGTASMGLLPGGSINSYAEAIDDSGTILAGYGDSGSTRAFRWTTGGGYQLIPLIPGTGSFNVASDISQDGATVVGTSGLGGASRAFRWHSSNPSTVTDVFGVANAGAGGVSGNGSVIAGTINGQAAVRAGGVTTMIPALPGQLWSAGEAISADGTTVTGRYSTGSELGYRWTAATGTVALPLTPSGCLALRPRAVNGDGTVIVGEVVDNVAGFTAFVWTPSGGTQLLSQHLTARGVNLAGWQLREATGISTDGRAMCGRGVYNGEVRGWVVRGLPCVTVAPLGFNNSACLGGAASIGSFANVPPTGAVIGWKKDGVPISNGVQLSGSTLSGATGNTLSITNMQPGDAGTYTFTMSSAGACEGSSSIYFAGPFFAPSIVAQPTNHVDCPGGNPFFFSTATTGAGSIVHRWQKFVGPGPNDYVDLFDGPTGNGGSYLGAGTSTFSILSAQMGDAATYRCRFTTTACITQTPVYSNLATLTLQGAPSLTGPVDSYQCAGDNDAFLTVTASPAAGCSYQWQKQTGPTQNSWVNINNGPTGNGGNYQGTQTATLGIYGFYAGDFANYRCRVTGPCGQVVVSQAALLTGATPVIVSDPVDTVQCQGDNDAFFTVTATPGAIFRWQ